MCIEGNVLFLSQTIWPRPMNFWPNRRGFSVWKTGPTGPIIVEKRHTYNMLWKVGVLSYPIHIPGHFQSKRSVRRRYLSGSNKMKTFKLFHFHISLKSIKMRGQSEKVRSKRGVEGDACFFHHSPPWSWHPNCSPGQYFLYFVSKHIKLFLDTPVSLEPSPMSWLVGPSVRHT